MNEKSDRPGKPILKRIGRVALAVLFVTVLAGLTSPVILKSAKDPLTGEIHDLKTIGIFLSNHAATHDGELPGSLEERGFRNPKNGKREPWVYYPGFISSDREDTIVAASPVTVRRGDRDDLRMALSLGGGLYFLEEADYQACIAEQSKEEWKKSGRDDPRSPWAFLELPVWQHWADEPGPASPPSPDEMAGLIKSLKAGERITRWNAADQLADIDPMPPQVVRALFDALGDSETAYHAARGLAVQSLRDETIIAGLVEKLRDGKGKEAYWAAVSLEDVGLDRAKEAIPLMTAALAREGDDIQNTAAKSLANAGPGAAKAVPQLAKVAASGDSWAAKCSVIALGRIGPPAREALPVLTAMFDAGRPYRMDVARSLWNIDPLQAQKIVPVLIARLEAQRSSEGEDRDMDGAFFSAIELLGEMGDAARPAIPILRANLKGGAKREAAWALARIDPSFAPEMVELIARGLNPAQPESRLVRLIGRPAPTARQDSGTPADRGLSICGMLWQLEPRRRESLIPVIVTLLREWRAEKVLNKLESDSRTAIPALEFLVATPSAPGVGPLAREALQVIRTTDYGQW